MDKETFTEIWDEYMEPLFKDGKLVFECSDNLKEHLMKVGNGEYTDDEIIDLMDDGKL